MSVVTAEVLERCLAELDADALDHLGALMRERAARLRLAEHLPPPSPPVPIDVHIPAEAIWEWCVVDMVRSGQPWRHAALVVADLAREVDHLSDDVVAGLLVRARRELGQGAQGSPVP